MRKLLCAALSVCLLCTTLAGCGSQPAPEVDEVDYNQYLNAHGSVALTSESMILFQDGLLYSLDLSLTEPLSPLCTDEDCDHTAPSCTARLEASGIGAWDDMLYYVAVDGGDRTGLYCMDIRGRARRLVKEMALLDEEGCTYRYQICGGCLAIEILNPGAEQNAYTIYVCSLEDDSQPECVFEDENTDYVDLELRDGWLFAYARSEGSQRLSLWGLELATGEKRLFAKDIPDTARPVLRDDQVLWFAAGDGAYTAPLESGQSAHRFYTSTDAAACGVLDDQYLYVSAGNALSIIDSGGQTVQTLAAEGGSLSYLAATADKVFFADGNAEAGRPQYWVDKTELAAGYATLHTIEQN